MRPFLKRESIFGTKVFGVIKTAVFRAQTFPHVETLYSDAFCLTGCPEQAADLVVAAYARAFLGYDQFRGRRIPKRRQTEVTLTWLFGNMHAAFCAGVLANADQTSEISHPFETSYP